MKNLPQDNNSDDDILQPARYWVVVIDGYQRRNEVVYSETFFDIASALGMYQHYKQNGDSGKTVILSDVMAASTYPPKD